MKKLTILLFLVIFSQLLPAQNDLVLIQDNPDAIAANLVTVYDAVKILGGQSHLVLNTVEKQSDLQLFRCAYVRDEADPASGNISKLEVLLETYGTEAGASAAYSDIRQGNQGHKGFETVFNLGNEAYFHSDGGHFYFIIFRKGNKIFRMKMNPLSSTASLESFKMAAIFISGLL